MILQIYECRIVDMPQILQTQGMQAILFKYLCVDSIGARTHGFVRVRC